MKRGLQDLTIIQIEPFNFGMHIAIKHDANPLFFNT